MRQVQENVFFFLVKDIKTLMSTESVSLVKKMNAEILPKRTSKQHIRGYLMTITE